MGARVEAMEGEVGVLSPARPSCVSSEGVDGRGFGSPTRASTLEKLLESPSSCVPNDRGGVNGSGFSSPTRGSPLEALRSSLSSCVSDSCGGGNGSASSSQASPLDTLRGSPSSCVSDSRGGGNSSSLRVSMERGREVQEAERLLRAIVKRYNDCYLCLRASTAEIAELRHERIRLGAENLQLSRLLEELETEQSKQASVMVLAPPLPKPVQAGAAIACAPKSISIRSKGFLSQKQPQAESKPQRIRVHASRAMEEEGEKETEDGGVVEVDAYWQGAQKTELCNKWERGACPFGGRCRFAHGVQELRPVMRHPRYKTLPCQMFAAASGCPYGHRCHFRHSLPPTAESC